MESYTCNPAAWELKYIDLESSFLHPSMAVHEELTARGMANGKSESFSLTSGNKSRANGPHFHCLR